MSDLPPLPDLKPLSETSSSSIPQEQSTVFAYRVVDLLRLAIMTVLALLVFLILTNIGNRSNARFTADVNIRNILLQVGVYGLVAVGMTFVILNRGIDLSVGGMVVLAGAVAAITYNSTKSVGVAISAAIQLGLIAGFVQGLIIVVLRIPSYIVTLAGAALFTSLALQLTEGRIIIIQGDDYLALASAMSGNTPALFINFMIAALFAQVIQIVAYFVVRRFQNPEQAATASSRNWTAIIVVAGGTIAAFTLMGLLAALSGVYLTSRLSSSTTVTGTDWPLIAIAAVIIGGTSVINGKGWFIGTIIGLIIVIALQNIMILSNVSALVFGALLGTVVVAAAVLNRLIEILLEWLASTVPILNSK